MSRPWASFWVCGFFLLLGAAAAQPQDAAATNLRKATEEGFTRYVQATEARIDKERARPGAFLYIEGLPEPRRSEALATLKQGEVYMEQLSTLDASGRPMTAPDGLIHHWMGAVFIPGATVAQVLALAQDYNHHQDYYQPEVVRSRLVSRDGNDFKIFYRLRKKKVITVTLNTDHDVHYFPVSSTRAYSRSYSTRIAQVENAGRPTEREKPVGQDGGFMWRLNSYWRFDAREGGVYVECESISLTRDIPAGLAWLIKPFITGIPRESLRMTMGSTRTAVHARLAAAPKP
jgi:hypothetical protein